MCLIPNVVMCQVTIIIYSKDKHLRISLHFFSIQCYPLLSRSLYELMCKVIHKFICEVDHKSWFCIFPWTNMKRINFPVHLCRCPLISKDFALFRGQSNEHPVFVNRKLLIFLSLYLVLFEIIFWYNVDKLSVE